MDFSWCEDCIPHAQKTSLFPHGGGEGGGDIDFCFFFLFFVQFDYWIWPQNCNKLHCKCKFTKWSRDRGCGLKVGAVVCQWLDTSLGRMHLHGASYCHSHTVSLNFALISTHPEYVLYFFTSVWRRVEYSWTWNTNDKMSVWVWIYFVCLFFLETFLCISRSTTSTTFVPSTVYLAFCIVTVCGQIDCIPDKYSFQNCAIYFSSNEWKHFFSRRKIPRFLWGRPKHCI